MVGGPVLRPVSASSRVLAVVVPNGGAAVTRRRRPSVLDLPGLMLPAALFISMINYSAWYWWWL